MRERGRGSAPQCPFCGAELKRPADIKVSDGEQGLGGACVCGAMYLVDTTGKNVGTIMSQLLVMAADSLSKSIEQMVPDDDYQDEILSYDWRNHRSTGVNTGYADRTGRLYIVKVKKAE